MTDSPRFAKHEVRPTFGERFGFVSPREAFQGRELDDRTRKRLWNAFATALPRFRGELPTEVVGEILTEILSRFLLRSPDDLAYPENSRPEIAEVFLTAPPYRVYELMEFVIQQFDPIGIVSFGDGFDQVLAEEKAGFRLLDDEFVTVSSEEEVQAIEDALEATASARFADVREHLRAALRILSVRDGEPDYRNSIKESISAVEGIVGELAGDRQKSFRAALKDLTADDPLHGALEEALGNLYGYTSDADGIRHSLKGESKADEATARFLFVICSAFVSFLIAREANRS